MVQQRQQGMLPMSAQMGSKPWPDPAGGDCALQDRSQCKNAHEGGLTASLRADARQNTHR